MSEEPAPKLRLKVQPPPPGPPTSASEVHDVKAILADNLRKEDGLRLNQPIQTKPRKSRRLRDYLMVIIGGNALIIGGTLMHGKPNVVSAIFGLSGIILFNIGVTWAVFHVMDDY